VIGNASLMFQHQELSRYTSAMDMALLRLSRARTPRELLAALNARPHQKPMLRCMPEAKRKESIFQAACQRIAVQVVDAAFDELEGEMGSPQFCLLRFQLQRDLRAIGREVPQVIQIAAHRQRAIELRIHAMPHPERCSSQRP
jgi:hypothetical protein